MKQGARYALEVEGLTVTVQRKAVKYMRLRIREPEGSLHVSAPLRVSDHELHRFVQSKRAWIERHQARVQRLAMPQHGFESGSTVPVWGATRRLAVATGQGGDGDGAIVLPTRAASSRPRRMAAVHAWYRETLETAIAQRLPYWERQIGAQASSWWVRNMRSRWGSCNINSGRICISLRVVVHPAPCLDYVLVHELAHLHIAGHNRAFWALVARTMPDWRTWHDRLRTARHQDSIWA